MRLIPGRLKGHARIWYDTQPLAATWSETKDALKQQFRKSVPFSRLLKKATNYESTPGQALGDYCFQKLNKLHKLRYKNTDEYLIDAVIGGITDGNVARTIRTARIHDANNLYAYMTTLEDSISRREENRSKSNIKNSRKDRYSKISHSNLSRNRGDEDVTLMISKTSTSDYQNKRACFNCGEAGHIAKKCRKPRVECDRLGHRTEECSFKKDVSVIKETDVASNLYVRSIVVNGHKIKGLIDTGSDYTLLRESVAGKCMHR